MAFRQHREIGRIIAPSAIWIASCAVGDLDLLYAGVAVTFVLGDFLTQPPIYVLDCRQFERLIRENAGGAVPMDWNLLVQRFGRSTIQSIWPEPASLIVGTPENDTFVWRNPREPILADGAWYGTSQQQAKPLEHWIAIDWDNPMASQAMGDRIVTHVNNLTSEAHRCHIPMLAWPSKSGQANPQGKSQHVFFYLPRLSARERERWAIQLLSTILAKPVVQNRFDPTLAVEGLDLQGHFLYPAVGVPGIKIGIAASKDLDLFINAWHRAFSV